MRNELLRRLVRFALLVPILLAAGCGFQLRGEASASLSAAVQPVYIHSVSATGAGTTALEKVLRDNGVALSDGAAAAKVVIQIHRDDLEERTLAVSGATGKAEQYRLIYTLSFSARAADGTELLPQQTIIRRRDYAYDASQVLSKHRERDQLRSEMARDAALQAVRRLESQL